MIGWHNRIILIKNKINPDMTYSQKLRDPRWQKKRLEILERDSFTCQHCHDHSEDGEDQLYNGSMTRIFKKYFIKIANQVLNIKEKCQTEF